MTHSAVSRARAAAGAPQAVSKDWFSILLPVAGAGVAIYLIAAPLIMLVYAAFRGPPDYLPFEDGAHWTFDNLIGVFADPIIIGQVLPATLAFVAGTVCLATVFAFTLAWLIERTDLACRNLWFAAIVLPSLVPVVVQAIAWILLMSPHAGWANLAIRSLFGLSGDGPIDIFSMGGLIFCQALATTPFVFLQFAGVLRSMDPMLEEASRASGATPFATFRTVTLPILLPGLLAPVILATLITFEQFELPLIIGLPAHINVFAFRIYNELNPASGLPNYGAAAAISLPFLALGLLALAAYNRAIRHADRFVTVTGKAYAQKRIALRAYRIPAYAFLSTFIAFSAILPIATLLWTSLFGLSPPGASLAPAASLRAYGSFASDPVVWRAAANSFVVAGLSAAIITVVGALVAWIVARTAIPGRQVLDGLTFLSLGIPAVIAGLAVMVLYLSLPIGVYGTVWILVIAYSYRLATASRLGRAALMQINRELEEASAASGARWLTTQARILLPLLAPSLAGAFILLFIIGMREFTIPFVLYSQENVVLSVLIWQLYQGGQPAQSAALGALMVVLVAPVVLIARGYLDRGVAR